MTRGIKGANIYIVDKEFKEYFKQALTKINSNST